MQDVTAIALEDLEVSQELMHIGGDWVPALSGQTVEVITPIDRARVIARTPRADKADADRAVAAARAAYPAWAALPFPERQRALLRIADDLEAAAEQLAQLTALD
nr:aldehyde dehydrogenase family protein [Actinomycetota bacterium]